MFPGRSLEASLLDGGRAPPQRSKFERIPRLAVDQVDRTFSPSQAHEVGHEDPALVRGDLRRVAADVRQEDHVVQGKERMVDWQWLLVEYIQRRTRDSTLLKRAH